MLGLKAGGDRDKGSDGVWIRDKSVF